MHSVHVSSQLLVSMLFIAVPTNTENFKFSYTCIYYAGDCGPVGGPVGYPAQLHIVASLVLCNRRKLRY